MISNKLEIEVSQILSKAQKYLNSEKIDDALNEYNKALSFDDKNQEAHFNKALILTKLNSLNDALDSYKEVLKNQPNSVDAFINSGVIFCTLKEPIKALKCFDSAINIQSNNSMAHNNRGNILTELGRCDEAIKSYEKAVKINPNFADANNNIALINLLLGKYENGWKLFEWRWKGPQKKDFRDFKKPLWLGLEDIKDKVILISAEQGLGDFIQFYRYCDLVENLGAYIIIETPKELFSLIKLQNTKRIIIEKDEAIPEFDYYCPIMSLPLAFNTTVDNVPSPLSYIKSDKKKSLFWHAKLGEKKRTRVGIVWSGAQNKETDQDRSLLLKQLKPILDLPIDFFSLQKEVRDIDKDFLLQSININDFHKDIKDFSDTAALICEMDIVISVDTSVAHLAGALGKPLWILLPFASDYRWMLDRIDSPWYPTATLFRQIEANNWENVLFSIQRSLESYV